MSALTQTLLPEPVAPGDEQVGHLGQVDRVRLARHVAAEGEGQLARRRRACWRRRRARRKPTISLIVVGDLDADDVLARDGRLDADRARGEGHGQVVGEALDARELDARVGPDLVLGHDRAGVDVADDRRPGSAKLRSFSSMIRMLRVVVERRPRRLGRGRSRAARSVGSAQSIADAIGRVGVSVGRQRPSPGASRPRRAADAGACPAVGGRRLRRAGRRRRRPGRRVWPAQTVWLIGAGLGMRRSARLVAGRRSAAGAVGRRPASGRLAAASRPRPGRRGVLASGGRDRPPADGPRRRRSPGRDELAQRAG